MARRRRALTIIAMGLALAACNRQSPPTQQEATVIANTEQMLRAKLKDPKSAKFRKVFVSYSGSSAEVCGEVDALNAFGAYSGYQRFIMGDALTVLESDYGSDAMDKTWARYCAR